MPTTLTNGIQLPDKGSVDWYSSMQSNYNLIDTHLGDTDAHVTAEDKANWNSKQGSLSQAQLDAITQVATNTDDIATLQSGKADASHTHSSSDITDIDDYATKDYVDNSISDLVDNAPDALNTLNELSAALNDDSNFASTVTTALADKANSADLATVATSGSYNDLDDLPTIPTNTSDLTNDSDFVVSSNLATVATSGDYDDLSNKPSIPTKTSDLTNDSNFVDSSSLAAVATSGDYDDLDNKPSIPTNTSDLNNDSGFVTLNDFDIPSKTSDLTNDSGFITSSDVPTSTSDLTNDSNFVDTSNPAVSSGITSAKVTDYDTHIADTDIHVTTADKATWNTVTSKANDSDVVHKSGDETMGGVKTFSDNLLVGNNNTNISISNRLISANGYALTTGNHAYSFMQLKAIVNYADTSSPIDVTVGLEINEDAFADGRRGAFSPNSNNATNLGKSGKRWANVYATNYYYGGSEIEFSQKFVTTDTAQTIGGSKIFDSNIYVYNSDNTATTPTLFLKNSKTSKGSTSETGSQLLKFIDKNNNILCDVESIITSTGSCELRLRSNTLDSNNQNVQTGVTLISSRNGGKNFCPTSDNNVFLGASTLKWSRVYSTNYYYGNDNVEFSTKFVTTDTNQTINGNKTFSEDIVIKNSDTAQTSKRLIISSSKVNLGDSNSDSWGITFNAGSSYAATIKSEKSTFSTQGLSFTVRTKDANDNFIIANYRLKAYTNGSADLSPETTDYISLGSSSNKWKDTCTNLINGVEPSSLSLPDLSNGIDISSYITDLTGSPNIYISPANGYIILRSTTANVLGIIENTTGMGTFSRGSNQVLAVYLPVVKNSSISIYTICSNLTHAKFIPCQGNV